MGSAFLRAGASRLVLCGVAQRQSIDGQLHLLPDQVVRGEWQIIEQDRERSIGFLRRQQASRGHGGSGVPIFGQRRQLVAARCSTSRSAGAHGRHAPAAAEWSRPSARSARPRRSVRHKHRRRSGEQLVKLLDQVRAGGCACGRSRAGRAVCWSLLVAQHLLVQRRRRQPRRLAPGGKKVSSEQRAESSDTRANRAGRAVNGGAKERPGIARDLLPASGVEYVAVAGVRPDRFTLAIQLDHAAWFWQVTSVLPLGRRSAPSATARC